MKYFFILFICILLINKQGIGQQGDFSIDLSLSSASISLGDEAILKLHVCDNAPDGNNYVANSLRIIVSMGINAEITGIKNGSDNRWALEKMSTGTGNTIRITNNGGTLYGNTCSDIILTVRGTAAAPTSTITSNIAFIAAINPLLNSGRGAPNAIQGNLLVSNDNSLAVLTVTASQGVPAVYPNPAIDRVYVTSARANSNIVFFDLSGRVLLTVKALGVNTQEIPLSNFLSGSYIVKVPGFDGATRSYMISKQ